ncbi:MAG TPA: beta-propeller fold lactonase family protein [Terracidiphilus sp.]|jgi:6-phosphogluconolactonase (cycloisomerase 2 family)
MKGLRWAGVTGAATALLAATAWLAGCKGFWDAPPGTGGGGTASGAFYVMNAGRTQVAGFAFASGSSTPSAISGGSSTFVDTPLAMAIAPGGGFLYVSTTGGIFAFSISSTGALTVLNTNAAISADAATEMAVDGTGAWLVESIGGTGILSAVPIDASTGIIDSTRTLQTVNLPNTNLNGIAVSPANSNVPYVFAAMGVGGTEAIPFSAASTGNPFGTLANIKAKNQTTGGASAIAVDPSNRLLYVGEIAALSGTQSGGLRVFTIGSSSINEVTGSPYLTAGTGPSAILPSRDGNFVYVANKAVSGATAGNITGYPINSTGGAYSLGTLINTIAAGTGTVGLAEDNTGTYVLAVNASNNNSSPDLSTYTFDATTSGKLVVGATASTGTDPAQAIAIVAVP